MVALKMSIFWDALLTNTVLPFMLCLHYVPGNHGSHDSPKCSVLWGFGHFCLYIQVLLRLVTFSHDLSRYPWQTMGAESWRLDSALRLGPWSATVDCMFPPGLPGSVGTSDASIKFCNVYQVLSIFIGSLRWNKDDGWCLSPFVSVL